VAKIQHKCPTCDKPAVLKSELRMGKLLIRSFMCGHAQTTIGVANAQEDTLDITSLDGKRPFPFQLEGGRFIENSNGRTLIADEMGLGKTVQAYIFLKAHEEARPFAVFAKAGLCVQWGKEGVRWGDFVLQVVDDTRTMLLPGFDGYIISQDSSWRIGCEAKKTPGAYDPETGKRGRATVEYVPIPGKTLPEQLNKCKVKTIVIDECQQIKNGASKRTNAIRACCEGREHVIALSGTPIKNNAKEYFPILNLLRPDKFPSERHFMQNWTDAYHDGYKWVVGAVKDPKRFLDYTKDFIIRRERADVLPDLPSVFRNFSFCDLGAAVEEEYLRTLREFNEMYDDQDIAAAAKSMNILAMLSKMRHLTGLAKIDPVCDYLEEFITSTDRKIMIFVHHKDVGQILKMKLEKMQREWPAEWGKGILEITSDMDSYARDEAVTKFRSSDYRIMIGSTLASGEGLNLQFCADCIMMERQWNPANEEQAEARFPRPGQTADKINATYFVAIGTVDEFFAELVEKKREWCTATMKGEAVKWDQSSLVSELGAILRQKGGQKWGW
jgi:SWI/SNF-related matrix-associated actin-dependent regulator of chromatin subfamily A-like protein 1